MGKWNPLLPACAAGISELMILSAMTLPLLFPWVGVLELLCSRPLRGKPS